MESAAGLDFQSRPERVTCTFAMRHFHEPAGFSDTNDPATWHTASYSAHPVDSLEPLPDAVNGYRQAALAYLKVMLTIDEFLTAAPDARVAVVAVAVVLGWPSTRGLSVGNIADQLGCSPSTLTRSIARFKTMAGFAGGGVRPGAGDGKPAAVQSVGNIPQEPALIAR